ncbi:MAG: glycoside hydrolase family 13 protein [Clostridia bacterium]|nr:glycoside hydrolase family 13 protein [Clostridia bacterium]
MRFFHHSRDLRFRRPQGAVTTDTEMSVAISAWDCGAEVSVALRLFEPGNVRIISMERAGDEFRCGFTSPSFPCLCFYDFEIRSGDSKLFYSGESGSGELLQQEGVRYQITVYSKGFETPAWFTTGIAYQIFPDRFFRSDDAAFRTRIERRRAEGRTAFAHESFSSEPLYLPHGGSDVYAPDDYHGGDLEGITEKLDYLKSLSVNCIYLNPIFEADSNHRYNTGDYMKIDGILGSNEDFDRLVSEANARGISVILDGVFSHTGADSRYFNRFGRYPSTGAYQSQSSPYYPWYRFYDYPEAYECWWDFPTLPNVNELEPSYGEFIHGEGGVLANWQRKGARGWRLDVADELPDDFIRMLRKRCKEEDPNAVLIGEVWENCSNKSGESGRRAYVDGDLLDGAMNYPFLKATLSFLNGRIDAYSYNERIQRLVESYPPPFLRACLNLISSHDEPRALSALSCETDPRDLTREEQAAYVPSAESIELGRKRLCQAMALQFTMVGVPCIYYGDEAGLSGMCDPFNRRTYPWGAEDKQILSLTKQLAALRKDSAALKEGSCRMGVLNGSAFALVRYTKDEVVITLINNSVERRSVILYPALLFEGADAELPIPFKGSYRDLNGNCAEVLEVLCAELEPNGFAVWRKEDRA